MATFTAWVGIDKGVQQGVGAAQWQSVATGMDKSAAWEVAKAAMAGNQQAVCCTVARDGRNP